MEKDTLYGTDKLKITYLHSPESGKENEVISSEDHELWIKDKDGEWNRYIIQRGILRELAYVSGNNLSSLVDKLEMINKYITRGCEGGGVTLRELEEAFIRAYQDENYEFQKYLAEKQKD